MIYTDNQLKEKISKMIESFESEVIEFKEARTNYSFNDIGKYFQHLATRQIYGDYRKRGWFLVYPMISGMWEQNLESKGIYKV